MQKLKEEELVTISGGAVKTGILAGILGAVALIIGVIDGFFRPKACN